MTPTTSTRVTVDIWSDVTCVWCHIGKRKFEAARDAYITSGGVPVDVEYHSYQLDTDPPVDYNGRYAEYLTDVMNLPARQVRDRFAMINGIGEELGLHFDWDNLQPANTLLAQQAIHFAEGHDKQAEMNDRLLAAYFEEGRNVGSIAELVDLAAEIGLNGHALRDALTNEEFLPAVRADIARAGELGIGSVPFFVIDGKYGVSGAQEADVFRQALERAVAERL